MANIPTKVMDMIMLVLRMCIGDEAQVPPGQVYLNICKTDL